MVVGNEEKKVEVYDDEDRKLLVSLLNEYSEKLALICKKIDIQSRKNSLHLTVLTAGILFTVAGGAIGFVYRETLFLTALLVSTFVFTGGVRVISVVSENLREKESSVRDARVIAKRLEKVVQLVSQMQEHSVNRISIRIEMDLRLADAEIALEHYEALTQKDQQLGIFARSLTRSVLKLR
jgi:phosphate starvation-inducible protein PhoH